MIVKNVVDIIGTEREVITKNWISRRILLEADGMGFSLHETIIGANTETIMQYRHHVEAVFCMEGEGEVELLATGATYQISPGVMYALDQHEHHVLRARSQLRLICVFDPPLHGREIHDVDGSYPVEQEKLVSISKLRENTDDVTHIGHL